MKAQTTTLNKRQIQAGTVNTGNVNITLSTSSTSTTSGALIVTGGVGIGGNLTVGGNVSLLYNNNQANVFIGTAISSMAGNTLQVNGSISATGQISGASFFVTSDYRMKKNVKPLVESTPIDVLNPVEYDLVGGSHDMGFLAHEVQEIFPF